MFYFVSKHKIASGNSNFVWARKKSLGRKRLIGESERSVENVWIETDNFLYLLRPYYFVSAS